MDTNLRHAVAGALVLCVGFATAPAVARAQSASTFSGAWEEMAVTAGPAWSQHGYYGSGSALGARIGGAVRVSSHLALRVDAQGAKSFGNASMCVNTYGTGASSCLPGIGALWGGTIGFGYLSTDASGAPRTFVSVAPGAFDISGSWNDTGGTGFGFRATVEQRLRKSASGALVVGIGVRAVLNVHHDAILDIPVELGGWSW